MNSGTFKRSLISQKVFDPMAETPIFPKHEAAGGSLANVARFISATWKHGLE